MAFSAAQYSITFADAQDRSHVVKIFPDAYVSGTTALDPADNPLTFRFGGSQDNEYRIINETVLEIRIVVTDAAVHTALFGQDEQSVAVQWTIDGALAWRGYLVTDDMEQPIDSPGVLVMRAACGMAFLSQVKWTPADTDRQTYLAGIVDALGDLSAYGVTLDSLTHPIGAAANWHAHDGGSAVSGNTLARYEFDAAVFQNPDIATEYYANRHVLEQLVGRFGAKVYNGDGRWRIYQRDLVTGTSYSMDKYLTAGTDEGTDETISEVEITNTGSNRIYADGAIKGVLPYSHVPIVYAHGRAGGSLLVNQDFKLWDSATQDAPTGWTRVRDATQTLDDPGGGSTGMVPIGPGGDRFNTGHTGRPNGPDEGIGGVA